MKDKVKAMYEDVTMPADCQARILRAAEERERKKPRPIWRSALSAAAVLALVICLAPPVWAAVENLVVRFFEPETGLTVYEGENERGKSKVEVHYDTETPPFAEVREGRLYFTGHGEEIDITDQVQEGKPYIYTYEKEDGSTVYMIVGMEGTVENFGIYTFVREENGQWLTGAGHNFLNTDTMQPYPWVVNLWEQLDIPWPMPG